jgi:hypothetical protein
LSSRTSHGLSARPEWHRGHLSRAMLGAAKLNITLA